MVVAAPGPAAGRRARAAAMPGLRVAGHRREVTAAVARAPRVGQRKAVAGSLASIERRAAARVAKGRSREAGRRQRAGARGRSACWRRPTVGNPLEPGQGFVG